MLNKKGWLSGYGEVGTNPFGRGLSFDNVRIKKNCFSKRHASPQILSFHFRSVFYKGWTAAEKMSPVKKEIIQTTKIIPLESFFS